MDRIDTAAEGFQVDGLSNGDVDLITGFRNNEPLRLEARGMEIDA